jgi:hypothetical protein
MALPSLTLRTVKGSPVTFAEMDTNLTNLQQADFNVTVGANTSPIRFDSTLTFAGGAGISLALNTSTRTVTLGVTTATTSTVGGIKVGANLTITADGTLSATASGSGFTGTVAILTATQSVFINGIEISRTGNNLQATLTSSTTTSGTQVTTGTLFQARLENSLRDDANLATTATNNGSVTFSTSSRFSSFSAEFGQDATQTTKTLAFTNTNAMNFGTGAWTVECWAFCQERDIQSPNFYHKLVQNTANNRWISFNDDGSSENFGVFYADDTNGVYVATTSPASPFIKDQWNHVVVMRSGGNIWMGCNGSLQRVTTTYTSQTVDWTNIKIGGNQSVGRIDSVRVSTGTIYSTSTYTVPTAEFPGDGGGVTTITTATALPFLPLAGGIITGTTTLRGVNETVVSHGNVTGTLTPNASSGTVHRMTLTGNITINALTNVTTGTNMTIIMSQDSTGTRTLTNTGWKWLGGTKTLTTTSNAIDIATIFYDGTTYYASLGKGYA